MKYYYLNRIAMAVLLALLLFFGTRTFIEIANEEHAPEKPGFEVAGGDHHGKAEKPAEEPGGGGEAILPLLASADAAQGDADSGLCKICHTFNAGGASLIGPNLYNVVNRKIASVEGFNYSAALKAKEGDWTYENLDLWLASPQTFAPGTTMAFPGIPDIKKRANVIAFLRSNAETPAPLPEILAEEPAAAEKAEEPAAAEEEEAEKPAAKETEEPAAEEPAAAKDEPAATEESMEKTLVVPPTLSEDAPSEPSMGEDPSPSQPQPVYPDEAKDEPATEETMEKTLVVPPTISKDAPSEPSMGEDPSPSQPQPVYPDEAMDSSDNSSEAMADDNGGLSSQPQPVYPDGMPGGDDSGSTSMAPVTENELSSQPQPVYPDGKPDGM